VTSCPICVSGWPARGLTGGCTASPKGARIWASMGSVLASSPTARAKLRTGRGWTTATGRPACDRASAAACSWPPVASRTIHCGDNLRKCLVSCLLPASSLAKLSRSPLGRMATSSLRWQTSIPPCPVRGHSCFACDFAYDSCWPDTGSHAQAFLRVRRPYVWRSQALFDLGDLRLLAPV